MEITEPGEVCAMRDYSEFERAVGAWHEYHGTEPASDRCVGTLQRQFPAPAYTATTFEPITSTTYRRWGALDRPTAIVGHINSTIRRCATASKAFENAITTLEITTHMFLAKHRPGTSQDRGDYLDALARAQTAGQEIFAPQKAYRDTISAFYVLATDIIDLLPDKEVLKQDQKAKYNQIIEAAQDDENDVRGTFREITSTKSQGVGGHPLLTYMETARQRWKNWQVEEGQLKVLAEETLDALL